MSEPISFKGYGFFTARRSDVYASGCPGCHRVNQATRKIPGTYSFEGRRCADFYNGYGDLIASTSVANQIVAAFPEMQSLPVQVNRERHKKFGCEDIVELCPLVDVIAYDPASSIKNRTKCDVCHREYFEVLWPEHAGDLYIDQERKMRYPIIVEPENKGVLIPRSALGQARVFSFIDVFLLCTEEFRSFVLEKGWTNISFTKAGKVV